MHIPGRKPHVHEILTCCAGGKPHFDKVKKGTCIIGAVQGNCDDINLRFHHARLSLCMVCSSPYRFAQKSGVTPKVSTRF